MDFMPVNVFIHDKFYVMAEIQVQTKKTGSSPAWLWIVVVLLIVGAVIYFLTRNKNKDDRTEINRTGTSWVQPAGIGQLAAA